MYIHIPLARGVSIGFAAVILAYSVVPRMCGAWLSQASAWSGAYNLFAVHSRRTCSLLAALLVCSRLWLSCQ